MGLERNLRATPEATIKACEGGPVINTKAKSYLRVPSSARFASRLDRPGR